MENFKNLKEATSGRGDVYKIDPKIIHRKESFNKRLSMVGIDELAESIRQNGVREPLKVYLEDGKVFLAQGYRRMKAIDKLLSEGHEVKTVPCIAEGKYSSEETRLVDQIICNDGVPFNMLEQGLVYKELVNLGWSQTDIATKVSKTPAHISNCIALSTVGKALQNLIIEGKAACSTVLNMLRECDENEELTLAAFEEVAKENKNNNNGNGNAPKPATASAVRRVLDPNRITPAKRLKELKEWLDSHDTNSYNGDDIYKAIKTVYEYVKDGGHSIDCIGELLKSE